MRAGFWFTNVNLLAQNVITGNYSVLNQLSPLSSFSSSSSPVLSERASRVI